MNELNALLLITRARQNYNTKVRRIFVVRRGRGFFLCDSDRVYMHSNNWLSRTEIE